MEVVRPARPCGTGVLVLAGSSGRADRQRAELLARHGAVAAPLQWFGQPDLQPGPWEVPLELFVQVLDALAPEVDRLAILGVSFGAEAALVTGSLDARVDHVAAFAPTAVTWTAYDEVRQRRTSKWTHRHQPVPGVPVVRPDLPPRDGPPSHRATYEHSLAVADPADLARATIQVERIAHVLLVSGGDDLVWPSTRSAEAIARRRAEHGLETVHVSRADAGHRTLLPGEQAPTGGRRMLRGGTPEADAALGRQAWPALCDLLGLTG